MYSSYINPLAISLKLLISTEFLLLCRPREIALPWEVPLALLRSLQKKEGKLRVKQGIANHQAIMQHEHNGILGGSDSFTIIGASGIGKSSSISRAVQLLTKEPVIEMDKPYGKILPCVLVQCPFDSSVKGLLLEIIRVVDEQMGSGYYPKATSVHATTDMLIGTVSQICLVEFLGTLIHNIIPSVILCFLRCRGFSFGRISLLCAVFTDAAEHIRICVPFNSKSNTLSVRYTDNITLEVCAECLYLCITQTAQHFLGGVSIGIIFADRDNGILRHNLTQPNIAGRRF